MSHFDSPRGSGWDRATGLPLHPEPDDEFLGKQMVGRDGVRRCLFCHTTNFRAVLDESGPEAADHSIGCETCHGPGGNHVAAVDAGLADMAIATPAKTPAAKVNKLCGQCHSMHNTSVIDAPRTDPVWYRFQSLTMTWSRCFTESDGKLSCVTCHDPHRDAETVPSRNEAKCLSCHSPDPGRGQDSKKAATAAKTRCPVNPTQGCITCHMPKAWMESTHSFKTDHYIRVREPDSGLARSGQQAAPREGDSSKAAQGRALTFTRPALLPQACDPKAPIPARGARPGQNIESQARPRRVRDRVVVAIERERHGVEQLERHEPERGPDQASDHGPHDPGRAVSTQAKCKPGNQPDDGTDASSHDHRQHE